MIKSGYGYYDGQIRTRSQSQFFCFLGSGSVEPQPGSTTLFVRDEDLYFSAKLFAQVWRVLQKFLVLFASRVFQNEKIICKFSHEIFLTLLKEDIKIKLNQQHRGQ